MTRCKTGDLAVIIFNPLMDEFDEKYVGTFVTVGKAHYGFSCSGISWEYSKPSQPLLNCKGHPYDLISDYLLRPIRGTDKTQETEKNKELECVSH